MHNSNNFIAIINHVMRLHSQTFDKTACSECGQSWPCKTAKFVYDSKGREFNPLTDKADAVDLGIALRHIDNMFSSLGTKGEHLVSAMHELALQPELLISGEMAPETEFQVSLRLNDRHTLLLWRLVFGFETTVHIHAAIDSSEGRHFLSALLTDSFAPVESEQLVQWWRSMDGASNRSVIFPLPHRPTAAIKVLQQLSDATMQLIESAVPMPAFDSYELL
jgi:hypothetical protein